MTLPSPKNLQIINEGKIRDSLQCIDFQQSDVVGLSQKLLGYKLCTSFNGQLTTGIIVETEAYRAPEDKASHAFGGRRTARTEVIYQLGGISYVYLCYGIHNMFNVVTGPLDTAHAILVRALQPSDGIEVMRSRRGNSLEDFQLTNGPGKLCQALGITRKHNQLDLSKESENNIWIERGIQVPTSEIVKAKRIGVDYADQWKEKLWRFYIRKNLYVSIV